MMTDVRRRELFWFFAIALLVLGAGIGLREPWPADEPRFVLVAKQMWDSGDWLFPHRGHELYADKPPLFFWLLGAAYALVRDWTWAFLLPSLVAAMATLWLTYDLDAPPVVASRGTVGGDRGAGSRAVPLPGQARADRSDGGVLHHARRVRHRAARAARALRGTGSGSVASPPGSA